MFCLSSSMIFCLITLPYWLFWVTLSSSWHTFKFRQVSARVSSMSSENWLFGNQNDLHVFVILTKASACFKMKMKAVCEETVWFSWPLTNIAVTRVIDCSNVAPTRGNYAHASGNFYKITHTFFKHFHIVNTEPVTNNLDARLSDTAKVSGHAS